jgi:hypothetical protein
MKHIILYSFLSIILFSSCRKEVIEPTPFQWPAGTSEYAPYTVGSTFSYQISKVIPPNTTPVVVDTINYSVTKDTTIDNLKYYKHVSNKPSVGPSPTYFTNFNNGKLTEITYNLDYLGLNYVSVPVVKENTLRTNVHENEVWNDDDLNFVFNGFDVLIHFKYKLVQKNYPKIILGNEYANTIAVKEEIKSDIPQALLVLLPAGLPTTSQFDNFYSKNYGLVERDISDGTIFKLIQSTIIK